MFHGLGEWVHRWLLSAEEFLRRHGLSFGLPSLGGGVALDSQHTLSWLSALGIVVGIVSTGGSFLLRLIDWLEARRERRRAGR